MKGMKEKETGENMSPTYNKDISIQIQSPEPKKEAHQSFSGTLMPILNSEPPQARGGIEKRMRQKKPPWNSSTHPTDSTTIQK